MLEIKVGKIIILSTFDSFVIEPIKFINDI